MDNKINNLILKAKDGDAEGIEDIINKLNPFLHKCCNTIYINGYDKEDLLQLGRISILKAIDKYQEDKGEFIPYAIRSIKNNFNYLIRSNVKSNYEVSLNTPIGEDIILQDKLIYEEDFVGEYINKEIREHLYEFVNMLKPEHKDLIYYIYLDKKGNLKEYSEYKGMKYMTVVKRKEIAIKKLKEMFRKKGYTIK
ncbi:MULTISPECIES: sigma-70 family RNA polymerase sigma factor [Clostridium]|uniref:Sigma-70 family RNA polymerase sigma factor n=1 Tax=Clostridium faecium TaxID=2762223 RepID=A0ABR8YPM7_9CLOT|nr:MULTISPECIES: sigma-70 family RNA polymerase sigma factor [Clostridium]MBD8046195.1 sigma-70 family RNA polymerase sigma factor [Clostridium faecium]MDU1350615.1 sigma-70 family RNA polymerase sigma factor [Clostridium argentinense]